MTKYSLKWLALLFALLVAVTSFVGCELPEEPNPLPTTLTEETVGQIGETTEEALLPGETDVTPSHTEKQPSAGENTTLSDKQPPATVAPSKTNKPTGTVAGQQTNKEEIPPYSGAPYIQLNNGNPNFSKAELTTKGYESYAPLDALGRCGVALASLGKETMPKAGEERGSISSIKPSGWKQASYDCIKGKYLYNRCHLIGWQLSAENANPRNLITGTRYFNTEIMLLFENMVADFIKETGYHVAYRITPVFEGNNLLCTGVRMEAQSVEDNGVGLKYHVFCYNVQPEISLNYADGSSWLTSEGNNTTKKVTTTKKLTTTKKPTTTQKPTTTLKPTATLPVQTNLVWVSATGKRYHSKSSCSGMNSPLQITLNEAVARGLTACGRCY